MKWKGIKMKKGEKETRHAKQAEVTMGIVYKINKTPTHEVAQVGECGLVGVKCVSI